ncbi:MAG: hypothetical protein AAF761_08450 [Pseudomonadota bacterium]
MKSLITGALLGAMLALPIQAIASEDTTALKTRLQASMQREVDRRLVEGALIKMDFETGATVAFYPVEAHAMILQLGDSGDQFVLCSDLKSVDGKSTTVDYYMARNGNRYTIFHTAIGNRAPLKKLMKEGKAKHLK